MTSAPYCPTFWDFFKSSYYSLTYLPHVDLSEQGISKHLLKLEDPQTAARIQRLTSLPEVQSILSEPLNNPKYQDPQEIQEKSAILTAHGFKLLGDTKLFDGQIVPSYNVIEHDELAEWVIIKSRALLDSEMAWLPLPITKEDYLLQVEMANHIAKVAREANIDIASCKTKLVAYKNLDDITEVNQKYCVICEKISILSAEETIQAIIEMDETQQQEIAQKISTIIQKAGFIGANFKNIRLTPDRKLAFVDTKPQSLMTVKKTGLWNKLFGTKGNTVESCAALGFQNLLEATSISTSNEQSAKPGLEAFYEEILEKSERTPKFSKWKIALSIMSIGLIPLVNAIIALVKARFVKSTSEYLKKINLDIAEKTKQYLIQAIPKFKIPTLEALSTHTELRLEEKLQVARQLQEEEFIKDHHRKYTPLITQCIDYGREILY